MECVCICAIFHACCCCRVREASTTCRSFPEGRDGCRAFCVYGLLASGSRADKPPHARSLWHAAGWRLLLLSLLQAPVYCHTKWYRTCELLLLRVERQVGTAWQSAICDGLVAISRVQHCLPQPNYVQRGRCSNSSLQLANAAVFERLVAALYRAHVCQRTQNQQAHRLHCGQPGE